MKNRLKEFRNEKCMTALELAMKIGTSENYIYMLEANRKKPSIEVAFKIARILNRNIEEIWQMEEHEWGQGYGEQD